jgi:hypothetical protein
MAIPSRFVRGLSFTPQKQQVKTIEILVRTQKYHNGVNKGCIVNSDVRALRSRFLRDLNQALPRATYLSTSPTGVYQRENSKEFARVEERMHIDLDQLETADAQQSPFCIVGGGIAGLMLAQQLARLGLEVNVLEAGGF